MECLCCGECVFAKVDEEKSNHPKGYKEPSLFTPKCRIKDKEINLKKDWCDKFLSKNIKDFICGTCFHCSEAGCYKDIFPKAINQAQRACGHWMVNFYKFANLI